MVWAEAADGQWIAMAESDPTGNAYNGSMVGNPLDGSHLWCAGAESPIRRS